MEIVFWGLGALAFIWLVDFSTRLYRVWTTPIQLPAYEVCDPERIPSGLMSLLEHESTKLIELGFRFSHAHSLVSFDARTPKPNFALVYYHSTELCFAEVENFDLLDHSIPVSRTYRSFCSDGQSLTTYNGTGALNLPSAPGHWSIDTWETETEDQLRAHLEHRRHLTQSRPAFSQPTLVSADEYGRRLTDIAGDAMSHLLANGAARRSGRHLQLSFKSAWRGTNALIANERRRKALRKDLLGLKSGADGSVTLPDLSHAEAYAYQKLSEGLRNQKLKFGPKLALLAASALAFAAIFGLAVSIWIVPLLIVVLLFHELGHLIAMKTFGYRDLQILFLPIGAAASGKNEKATGLQRTLVYLAGPVPGLLLAAALWWLVPSETAPSWFVPLIFALVLINYLNLLPIMPLDGGQIVNLVLFERRPRLHVAFLTLSAAIFALSAWHFSDGISLVLSVVLVFMALKQWGYCTILDRLERGEHRGSIEPQRIFAAMCDLELFAMSFGERFTLAQGIEARVNVEPVTTPHRVICGSLYLTALFAPLGFAFAVF